MEFQIDFGNVPAPAPAPTFDRAGPLFAAAPGVLLPLGGDEVVLRLRAGGSHHVMTRDVFEALARCSAFRGLDQHVADILAAQPALSGRGAAVRAVLEQLVGRGLLVSADDWLRATTGSAPAAAPQVAIRHANGAPGAAWLDALASAQVPPARVIVFGDDGVPADALARLRARGIAVLGIGAARRRAWLERLARAVPGAAAAIPSLFSDDEAGTRNLASLLAANGRLLWLDGRASLPLHHAPALQPGLELAATTAVPVSFHARFEDALSAGQAVAGDPVAALLAGCGEPVGAVLAEDGPWAVSRADLYGLEPAALAHLAPQARIAAVVAGQRGAAREAGREWLFLLDAASRERFWSDRDLYLRTLDQPSVWHGPSRARLQARTLESPLAFDAGAMLPPLFGREAGDAALWGLLLHAIRPLDPVLHAPLALAVAPDRPSRTSAGWAPETPGLGALLTDLLAPRASELRAAAPAARLQALAASLRDLAGAPPATHAELLSEYLGFCRADLVARLQSTFLAAADAPVHWQADVRALVEANGRALIAGSAPRLAGWPQSLDEAGCAARLAQDVAAIAGALEGWPALWQHAVESGAALPDA
ncbi:MAG: hypothetical protein LW860_19575 [Xanthomonadaceae bacterium]|jgi:hypothetical protein|nr:hypothetical protein [Xanthomonadaceae bacterium]